MTMIVRTPKIYFYATNNIGTEYSGNAKKIGVTIGKIQLLAALRSCSNVLAGTFAARKLMITI